MNLINDPWIPVRRQSGKQELIAPWQLTEIADPIIALNAPRPDFNGALIQFLIGLLQTTATPADDHKWLDWLEEPPTPAELKGVFSQYVNAFELDHENGSFMQDFEALESGFTHIGELLIDSPGNKTIKDNKDHFMKSGQNKHLCPSCATISLFTLQLNAPAGGQGHRTSLRGGGPLTTIIIPDESSDLPNDLWRKSWLNIVEKQLLGALTGSQGKSDLADIFPWMTLTRTSEKETGKETTPLDVHPLQMYWGMPRRIKIDWQSNTSGNCELCNNDADNLVSQYRTKNYGVNYTGAWQHPLSPYLFNQAEELLPQHAQPSGLSYRYWLGLVETGSNNPNAITVKRFQEIAEDWKEQFRLHAFGYDMDNMKARCWYDTTFPLITIPDSIRDSFIKRVQTLTDTANMFAGFVRSTVKEAWFSRPGDAKGDVSFINHSFFQSTEDDFYQALKKLQPKLEDGTDPEVLHSWHAVLRKTALNLFDYWATRGDISQGNPRRVAVARNKLKKLIYSKNIKEALMLPQKRRS